MKQKTFWLIILIAFFYIMARYECQDADGRFDAWIVTVLTGLFFIIPVFLLMFSSYILLHPRISQNKAWWFVFLVSIAVSCSAISVVGYYYGDEYESTAHLIWYYFFKLNTGTFINAAEDFRLEYFLFLLFNLVSYYLFFRKQYNRFFKRSE